MTCQEVQEQLSAYVDGELPPGEAQALQRHLEQCVACRELADELTSVARVLSSLPRHAAPAELSEEIRSRLERQLLLAPMGESAEIAARADRRLSRERPAMWPRVAAVAASVILALGILWLTLLPDRGRQGINGPQEVVKLTEDGATRIASDMKTDRDGTLEGSVRKSVADRAALDAAKAAEPVRDVQAVKELKLEAARGGGAGGYAAAIRQADKDSPAENVLMVETDLDASRAQAELAKVFDDVGWQVAAEAEAGPKGREAVTEVTEEQLNKAQQYGARVNRAAGRREVVYVGLASPSQVVKLSRDMANNAMFRVKAEASSGAFVTEGPAASRRMRAQAGTEGRTGPGGSVLSATTAPPASAAAPSLKELPPRPTTEANSGDLQRCETMQETPAAVPAAPQTQAEVAADSARQLPPAPTPGDEAVRGAKLANEAEKLKAAANLADAAKKSAAKSLDDREKIVVVVRLVGADGKEGVVDSSLMLLDKAADAARASEPPVQEAPATKAFQE